MRHPHRLGRFLAASVIVPLLLGAQQTDTAAQSQAPADVRAVLEGTWELDEWHVDGQVMRPPQMTGRWSVHDGVVMAIRHRDGPNSFESTAGYGAYQITATEWIYGYERSEDAAGPSASEAKLKVTVTQPIPMRSWKISREGPKLILDGPGGSRWEFEGRSFVLMTNGNVVRKYRKVQ